MVKQVTRIEENSRTNLTEKLHTVVQVPYRYWLASDFSVQLVRQFSSRLVTSFTILKTHFFPKKSEVSNELPTPTASFACFQAFMPDSSKIGFVLMVLK